MQVHVLYFHIVDILKQELRVHNYIDSYLLKKFYVKYLFYSQSTTNCRYFMCSVAHDFSSRKL